MSVTVFFPALLSSGGDEPPAKFWNRCFKTGLPT